MGRREEGLKVNEGQKKEEKEEGLSLCVCVSELEEKNVDMVFKWRVTL